MRARGRSKRKRSGGRRRHHVRSRASVEQARRLRPAARGKTLEALWEMYDDADTLWPTTPVVNAANEALIEWCSARLGVGSAHAQGHALRPEGRIREHSAPPSRPSPPETSAREPSCRTRRYESRERRARMIEAGIRRTMRWLPWRRVSTENGNSDAKRDRVPRVDRREAAAAALSATSASSPGSSEVVRRTRDAGLGEFFDFELSAEALIDEHMVPEMGVGRRGPHRRPARPVRASPSPRRGFSGDSDAWAHVGDGVLNDCYAAKQFDFRRATTAGGTAHQGKGQRG